VVDLRGEGDGGWFEGVFVGEGQVDEERAVLFRVSSLFLHKYIERERESILGRESGQALS
jgi:hypothetical protein